METCQHEFVIKDGSSDNDTYKIPVCVKCHSLGKVTPRNEKPKEPSVWEIKDAKICRMSVLKVASELVCQSQCGDIDKAVSKTKELAEIFEKWVNRNGGQHEV